MNSSIAGIPSAWAHFVAHDHGCLVVGQLELLEDAGIEGDLAATCTNALISLPFSRFTSQRHCLARSFHRPVCAHQLRGDGAQPLQLGMALWRQRALARASASSLLYSWVSRRFQSRFRRARVLRSWDEGPTSTWRAAAGRRPSPRVPRQPAGMPGGCFIAECLASHKKHMGE